MDYTDKPERPDPDTDLVINAQVVGVNSSVAEVKLIYRVMFGGESTVSMTQSPPGSGNYTAEIRNYLGAREAPNPDPQGDAAAFKRSENAAI